MANAFTSREQNVGCGKHHRLILTDANGNNSVTVVPTIGALVEQVTLNRRQLLRPVSKDVSPDGVSPVSQADEERWLDGLKTYPGMLLAPWVNRTKDGRYTWKNKEYNLPINEPDRNNSLHGFVYNKVFKLQTTVTNEDFALVVLMYDNKDEELPGYPWKFQFSVEYKLEKGNFSATLRAKPLNETDEFPFCAGWHPYFYGATDSLQFVGTINNCVVEIPSGRKISTDERLIPTGNSTEFPAFSGPLSNQFFDSSISVSKPNGARDGVPVIETKFKSNTMTIGLWQNFQEFPIVHIYTPDTRDAMALEPVSDLANCFNSPSCPTLTSAGWTGKCGLYVQLYQ